MSEAPRRKPGRPRKPGARRAMVHVRCTAEEREELRARGVDPHELLWPSAQQAGGDAGPDHHQEPPALQQQPDHE